MRALAPILLTVLALAQTNKPRAQALLQEGLLAYENHDFATALQKFQEAYRNFQSPRLILNIGATYRELGQVIEALDHYERFFREAGPDIPAELRAEAQADADLLRDRVGEIVVDAKGGSQVRVDGREIGTAPVDAVRVVAGTHLVEVDTYRETVAVPGRGRVVVRLPAATPGPTPPAAVVPVVSSPPVEPTTAPAQVARQGWRAPRWSPWVALGLGLAAAGAGTLLGLRVLDEEAALDDRRPAATGATISFALAGVALASAPVLWWFRDRGHAP